MEILNFSQKKIGIWSQSNGCFKSGAIWVLDIYTDSFYLISMVLGQVYFRVSSEKVCTEFLKESIVGEKKKQNEKTANMEVSWVLLYN